MQDPNHLREQARRCRSLAKSAIEPELIEQLRVWSIELADEADAAERAVETSRRGLPPDISPAEEPPSETPFKLSTR
jgi:hypothetical protein